MAGRTAEEMIRETAMGEAGKMYLDSSIIVKLLVRGTRQRVVS